MPTPTGASVRDPYAVLMTRDEATARAAALNAEASADEHWLVREAGTHTESRPKPEEPDDPRPALFRNIPPFGPG